MTRSLYDDFDEEPIDDDEVVIDSLGEPLLTVKEAATFLSCSEANIRRMIHRHCQGDLGLDAVRCGSGERAPWRIRPDSIRNWLKRGPKAIAKAGEERPVFRMTSSYTPNPNSVHRDPSTGRLLSAAEYVRLRNGEPIDPADGLDEWVKANRPAQEGEKPS